MQIGEHIDLDGRDGAQLRVDQCQCAMLFPQSLPQFWRPFPPGLWPEVVADAFECELPWEIADDHLRWT
jgi:hypothetical protein